MTCTQTTTEATTATITTTIKAPTVWWEEQQSRPSIATTATKPLILLVRKRLCASADKFIVASSQSSVKCVRSGFIQHVWGASCHRRLQNRPTFTFVAIIVVEMKRMTMTLTMRMTMMWTIQLLVVSTVPNIGVEVKRNCTTPATTVASAVAVVVGVVAVVVVAAAQLLASKYILWNSMGRSFLVGQSK